MSVSAVIFDWDGTIINSEKVVYQVYKEIISDMYKYDLKLEEFRDKYTPDYNIFMDRIGVHSDDNKRIFNAEYARRLSKEKIEIVKGMSDILNYVSEVRVRIAVFTGSNELVVKQYIAENSGLNMIENIIAKEHVEHQKPAMEGIDQILRYFEVSPSETIMIGDTEQDMIAGQLANVFCIGVEWGYHSKEKLWAAGADAVCNSPVDLLSLIKKMVGV